MWLHDSEGCGLTGVPVQCSVECDGVPIILHPLHGLLQRELFTSRATDPYSVCVCGGVWCGWGVVCVGGVWGGG